MDFPIRGNGWFDGSMFSMVYWFSHKWVILFSALECLSGAPSFIWAKPTVFMGLVGSWRLGSPPLPKYLDSTPLWFNRFYYISNAYGMKFAEIFRLGPQ